MHLAKQFSLFDDPKFREDGVALRDKGMAKVEEDNPDWLTKCIDICRHSVGSDTFTGEDIRMGLEMLGLYPTHPNAWGALTRQLLKLKLIEPTGELRAMRDPRSHARKTMVYRRVQP